MNTKYGNFSYTGSVPTSAGDRWYGQDRGRDFYNNREYGASIAKSLANNQSPFIISGLNVSQGTGYTISISKGSGVVKFSVKKPSGWSTLPPTISNIDIDIIVEIPIDIVDMSLLYVLGDNSTIHYVKLKYKETSSEPRVRALTLGTYDCEISPDYELTINSTAPTTYELVLAKFISDGSTLKFVAIEQKITSLIVNTNVCNDIINSRFDHWQRFYDFFNVANGQYTTDRFVYMKNGSMVHRIRQGLPTLTPPYPIESGAKDSVHLAVTTPQVSLGAGDYVYFEQKIEGINFNKYRYRYGILTFWIRSSKPGIYCIAFRNDGRDRFFIAEYTITASNTWEKKTITVLFNEFGGTWNTSAGIGISIAFVLACGSTNQTSNHFQWAGGDKLATSNQVNACDALHDIYITDVCFNVGVNSIQNDAYLFDVDLMRCQRYYEKTYLIEDPIGVPTALGRGEIVSFNVASGWYTYLSWEFKYMKRIKPIITQYNVQTGAVGTIQNDLGTVTYGTILDIHSFSRITFRSAGTVINGVYRTHYTADAEL